MLCAVLYAWRVGVCVGVYVSASHNRVEEEDTGCCYFLFELLTFFPLCFVIAMKRRLLSAQTTSDKLEKQANNITDPLALLSVSSSSPSSSTSAYQSAALTLDFHKTLRLPSDQRLFTSTCVC